MEQDELSHYITANYKNNSLTDAILFEKKSRMGYA